MNDNIEFNMLLGKNVNRHEQFSDMHVCTFCETKFNNVNSLNLHCQLHDNNKNFTCLMCKEVFFDLQQLKLHDLRHSIEEAHGDASNIENISFSGFISCSFCGEKFSSDEELINHCVVHPLKDAGITSSETPDLKDSPETPGLEASPETTGLEDLNSDLCDSDEEQLSYRILRQEIISPKNGRSHKQLVRLTLIDEHDVQVEEFTRIIKPKKILKRKSNLAKANNIPKKSKTKPLGSKTFNKENKSDKAMWLNDNAKTNSEKVKAVDSNSEVTLKDNEQGKRDSSDSDCQVISDSVDNSSNKQERKSKLIAIRKKLWKDKIEIPAVRKVFSRAQNKFVYKCKKCRLVFDRFDALNKHKEKDCSQPNLRKCPDCDKSFTNLSEYNKHCRAHKEIGKFSCDECKEEFTVKSLYRQHVIDNHDSSEKSKYDCRICNQHFVIKCDLDNHWAKHFNLKTFICCQCQRTFKNLSLFKGHTCSRDNLCHMCEKIFSRGSHLLRHLRNVHKLNIPKNNSFFVKKSSEGNISSVVNGERSEHASGSSPEPKLLNETDKNNTKIEESDTEIKSELEEKKATSDDSDKKISSVKTVNSKMTNNLKKKSLVQKKPNSSNKSHVSMKRKANSNDGNQDNSRLPKKPKLKISESIRKSINKKVLLKKKASVMNIKTKSKMSATRYSIPLRRKQPVKKVTVKSSNKSLSAKKTNNKFVNKSKTAKKPVIKKKGSGSVKIKKNLVPKKAGKSVTTLNSLKKLKKSK